MRTPSRPRAQFLCSILFALAVLAARPPVVLGDDSAPPEPVFHFRTLQKSFRKLPENTPEKMAEVMRTLVPDDIKKWAVVSLTISELKYNILEGDSVVEFAKRFDQLGYRFLVEVGDPTLGTGQTANNANRRAPSLEDLDAILASCKNCIGIETGETFWAFSGRDNPLFEKWLLDLLKICAKHDRYFLLGEGTWTTGHWTRYFDKNYQALGPDGLGRWFVGAYKNTKPWGALQTMSSLYGAWATGLIGNYGVWNDPWTWCYSSFGNANELPPYVKADKNHEKVPYTYYLRMWLLGISQGTVFNCTEEPGTYSREGKANSNFSRYLHPFIKGIGENKITPSRQAVLAKTKAMVNPFGTYQTSNGPWEYDSSRVFVTYLDNATPFSKKSYDPFTKLYRNTYGFDPVYDATDAAGTMFAKELSLPNRLTRETIPNSSRYYAIPILPHRDSKIPAGMRELKLWEVQDDKAIADFYQSLYAADAYGTEAYALEVDNSLFVLNSNENLDKDQFYKLKLGAKGILSMEGKIPFQNFVFGKRRPDGTYWFQTNGYFYPGDTKLIGQRYVSESKPTVITFASDTAPVVKAEPGMEAGLQITTPWNPKTKTTTISCSHTLGAVNFTIAAASP